MSTRGKWLARFVPIIIFLCSIVIVAPKAAWAHAVLVSSTPAVNAEISGPDFTVLLKYNSRVDAAHSTLSLLAPDGKVIRLTIASQTSPELVSAKATGLAKGAYVLHWQVLASDGHITRGEIPFHVR